MLLGVVSAGLGRVSRWNWRASASARILRQEVPLDEVYSGRWWPVDAVYQGSKFSWLVGVGVGVVEGMVGGLVEKMEEVRSGMCGFCRFGFRCYS